MRIHFSLPAIILSVAVTVQAFAGGASGKVKSGAAYVRVSQAAGRINEQSDTSYIFHIVWSSTRIPTSFFWRGSDGWMVCRVISEKGTPQQDITADLSPERIKKGNKVQIVPMPGGKYEIPGCITSNMHHTLFFTTGSNQWYSVPVKNIRYRK
ncbi:hypothetical protein ACTHGU_10160 [Chitinophagaceae bacterium MMS25-I14]